MKQIGFKNFRRFADFPAMDLAPITIFVGENNSGKSTVVKGILALSDFLNTWRTDYDIFLSEREIKSLKKKQEVLGEWLRKQQFFFNTSYLAHIGTFKRALYNKAENNTITFKTSLGFMDVELDVMGDKSDEEAVSGIISRIIVYYNSFGISILFDLLNDLSTITFYPYPINDSVDDVFSSKMKKRVDNYFASFDDPVEIKTRISDNLRPYNLELISNLVNSIEIAINATINPKETPKTESMDFLDRGFPIEGLSAEKVDFLKMYCEKLSFAIGGNRKGFSLPGSQIYLRLFNIEYLYAHAVTQTVIYSAKDTNDYLSRTIHEYASLPTQEYKHAFIVKWMKEFGIGLDYTIRSVGGEAHIVYITNNDGEEVNLADKGMGSIQLMVLLFRLAIALPTGNEKAYISRYGRIIIIEEPEQNLHPMLQSKLADLLYELNSEYGYRFIIETHSEYLIRKTQVIVKKKFKGKRSLKGNPFKVYYFNSSSSDIPYYEIVYQKDGSFENDFGKGFFDEASNLAFEIL